jgi:hypothetical protein
VIEHQPDLISHLIKVEMLLSPGGSYCLAIPDKRYCFDHYAPESTLAEVDLAFAQKRLVHTPAAVAFHHTQLTHDDPIRHWIKRNGRPGDLVQMSSEEVAADVRRAEQGQYVDVHAWMFTPLSFSSIVKALYERGQIELYPQTVYDTGFATSEFYAVLARSSK